MRLTIWLLVLGIGFCGFLWLNNRVSYKYEADIAETVVNVHNGTLAQRQQVQDRGRQLDRQLLLIQLAMVAQGAGIVVLLVRLNRPAA